MAEKLKQLKEQMIEKKRQLSSLSRQNNPDIEGMNKIRDELDSMLYIYFKSLNCSCDDTYICVING